mmetsp:Transcript_21283/g.50787  ORF Transcript_21283/g.50787 Transcript_21283/m.50787 type:complete len:126 (-) Transcript_21283:161-538(-)
MGAHLFLHQHRRKGPMRVHLEIVQALSRKTRSMQKAGWEKRLNIRSRIKCGQSHVTETVCVAVAVVGEQRREGRNKLLALQLKITWQTKDFTNQFQKMAKTKTSAHCMLQANPCTSPNRSHQSTM